MRRRQRWTSLALAIALCLVAPSTVLGGLNENIIDKQVQTPTDPAAECAKVVCGTEVTYCYPITNMNGFTLTNLLVLDDQLGQIAPPPDTLDPFATTTIKVGVVIGSAVTNTVTATAMLGIDLLTDTASASVECVPQLTLEKTVDLDGDCIGGSPMINIVDFPPVNVTYCYKVTNPVGESNVTYTTHSLQDTVLGTININPPCTLAPGQMCVVSQSAMITESIKNTATWTAVSDTVPLPCGVTTTITNSAMSMAMVTLETPTNTPTSTPTSTDTPTATQTPTVTQTATPTNTPVPEGGACTDTAQCESGLFCVDNICTDITAPAPAASGGGLMIMIGLLMIIGAFALWRLRRAE